ncbi:MAG: YHS domain-containing protein [Verrucomicrobiota bacterium]
MKTKLTTLVTTLFLGLSLSAADVKPYPLQTCVVSGNELGSMGKPIKKVYDGQEIIFCCKPCIKKFEANPAKYLPKLKK